MRISLKQSRLGLRNSTTRLPFRYGNVSLTRCPQAVLEAVVEVDGRLSTGYSGDCLPPGWFDKTPSKNYADQIDDMLAAIRLAQDALAERLRQPQVFFPAWLSADDQIHAESARRGWPGLLGSFGLSLVERAIVDAVGRAAAIPFHKVVHENLLGIAPGEVHSELSGTVPSDWLPREPRRDVYVRHTVGLADPLFTSEIPATERLDDGFPQALEEYVQRSGIRFFKIKLANQLDADIAHLESFVALVEPTLGDRYRVTLDGNEQYKNAADFTALIERLRGNSRLANLLHQTLVIEQPLDRHIALETQHTAGIRELAETIPTIIDESDGTRDAYRRAIECGYRGISSKSCKGVVRSLLNAGLTWHSNDRGENSQFIMTGEDLCSVGVVPVQSDLCLVATLGLEHLERNGHHYHPGLSYLTPPEQQAACQAHPDFYHRSGDIIAPRVVDGHFQIGSLQCPGLGFAALPDMESMESPDDWKFASLGLES